MAAKYLDNILSLASSSAEFVGSYPDRIARLPIVIKFATKNNHKIEELRLMLIKSGISYILPTLAEEIQDIQEIQSLSQFEVAKDKAQKYFRHLKTPVLTDDTGLFFENCNSFPGTYTKMLAVGLGIQNLSKLFEEGDSAYFQTTLLVMLDSDTFIPFVGRLNGRLTKLFMTSQTKSLDDLFVPRGLTDPLGCIPAEQRINFSHRALAFSELVKFFQFV